MIASLTAREWFALIVLLIGAAWLLSKAWK